MANMDAAGAQGDQHLLDSPVSVIVPVLNEAAHLGAAVDAILQQQWPPGIELVLAVGPSIDGTEDVAAHIAAADARVTVVANPSGRTPDALNAAIAASRHDVVIRVDAHTELPPGYVDTAVRTLVATGADNVGGIMQPSGRTDFERAVAVAMTSPIGVGAAAYHTGGRAGESESVYLGSFRRRALQQVGGYDSRFTRAQDWEMNHRIRRSGGRVWFTPEMVVTYRPRPTLRALARQYFQYGQWRRLVMRVHQETRTKGSALRYLAPPMLVFGLAGALLCSLVGWLLPTSMLAEWLADAIALPVAYLIAVAAASLVVGRRLSPRSLMWLPVVIATMHVSWGLGFIRGERLNG